MQGTANEVLLPEVFAANTISHDIADIEDVVEKLTNSSDFLDLGIPQCQNISLVATLSWRRSVCCCSTEIFY